jgi:hypothetical protein
MWRSRALDLDEFDAVVIHYSLILSNEHHVSWDFRAKLQRFPGLKAQFIQDEYRWVDRATTASREAGISILFTAAPEPAAGQLYDTRLPGVKRVHTLTGYVPESLAAMAVRPIEDRTIDVSYRGRDLPYWLGRLTQEKTWVAEGFLKHASRYGLRTDIAWREADRIYGKQWVDLIASSRATLGTESGASIADFDGGAERAVRKYMTTHPGASYAEVHEAVLEPYEGNVVVSVISPRVFEAAALGTGLIMFPGHYSGIVMPDVHYIPLERDFSNMDDVVAKLKDDAFMTGLTRRARQDVVDSGRWSYAAFIREFDDVMAQGALTARGASRAPRHRLATIERKVRVPPVQVRLVRGVVAAASAVTGRELAPRRDLESGSLVTKAAMALRAALGESDLRPVYREGRRAGMAIEGLLDEILELSLLRRSAAGTLGTIDKFTIASDFDAQRGCLRFTSWPKGTHAQNAAASSVLAADALRSGAVSTVEWDHSAVGAMIRVERPRVDIGIGTDGFKNYALLADIGRRNPLTLERALAPAVASGKVPAAEPG